MSLRGTCAPENVGALFCAGRLFSKHNRDAPLQSFAIDIAHPYKHIAVATRQPECAPTLLRDPIGTRMVATLRAQPFGPIRAPKRWARESKHLQFIMIELRDIFLWAYLGIRFFAKPPSTTGACSHPV